MPIHRSENNTAIVVVREMSCYVAPFIACTRWHGKPRVGISRGIARPSKVRPVDRAILNLRIRSKTIHHAAIAPSDSAVRRGNRFVGVEFLHRVSSVVRVSSDIHRHGAGGYRKTIEPLNNGPTLHPAAPAAAVQRGVPMIVYGQRMRHICRYLFVYWVIVLAEPPAIAVI